MLSWDYFFVRNVQLILFAKFRSDAVNLCAMFSCVVRWPAAVEHVEVRTVIGKITLEEHLRIVMLLA